MLFENSIISKVLEFYRYRKFKSDTFGTAIAVNISIKKFTKERKLK